MRNIIKAFNTFKIFVSVRKFFVKLDTFFKRILGPRYKWILALLFKYMTVSRTLGRYFWYLNIFIAMFYYIITVLKINIDLDIETILLLFYFIGTNLLDKIFDCYDYIFNLFNKIIDKINSKLPSKDEIKIKRENYPSRDKKVLEPMNKTFESVKDVHWSKKYLPNYSLNDIPTWFWVVSSLALVIGIVIIYPSILTTK